MSLNEYEFKLSSELQARSASFEMAAKNFFLSVHQTSKISNLRDIGCWECGIKQWKAVIESKVTSFRVTLNHLEARKKLFFYHMSVLKRCKL